MSVMALQLVSVIIHIARGQDIFSYCNVFLKPAKMITTVASVLLALLAPVT